MRLATDWCLWKRKQEISGSGREESVRSWQRIVKEWSGLSAEFQREFGEKTSVSRDRKPRRIRKSEEETMKDEKLS